MSSSPPLQLHATDSADRVREHTATSVQADLDQDLVARVRHYLELEARP